MNELTRGRNRKFGPYICVKLLGAGGQSAVYSAMHEATGRMVALRALAIAAKDVDEALAECKEVVRDIASIDAPNLVAIEDYGDERGVLYITMNVMYGGSLGERMKLRGLDGNSDTPPLLPSPGEVLAMAERITIALDELHDKGIVHGQISPSSIMFNSEGQAFLADVGFTKLMKIIYRLDATNSFNMTKYSAPELWDGERPSSATDQYAFACVIYELLTGQAPFDAPSIFGLMQAHANNVASPPHYVRRDLPQDLAMVFWQALAKPVDRRYQSMGHFLKALARAFEDKLGESTSFFTFPLE